MVAVFKPKYDILIFWAEWLEWCDGKLIMVPVWFTRGQLPATVMKLSQKVKETKNDVYLSDDNLADDEEALHNQREKERKK